MSIKRNIVLVTAGCLAGAGVTTVVLRVPLPPTAPHPPAEIRHTADWYVQHRGVMQQDEKRCNDNIGTIGQLACENIDHAETRLFQDELSKEGLPPARRAGSTPTP
jgi:hypothetical protein